MISFTIIAGVTYSVDETMIKFKRQLGFYQYMPVKSIKWGVKVWILGKSRTGYVVNLQVYTGHNNQHPEHGLSHRVLIDMSVATRHPILSLL